MILDQRPWSNPLGGLSGWGQKLKKSTSSEHGHVAYEIKWTHKCSNMVASVLPAEPPPDPVGGLKIPLF